MKNHFFLKNGLAFGLVSVLMFTSCLSYEFSKPPFEEESGNNSVLFPTNAKLFGKHNEDWAIRLAKASVALECNNISLAQLLNLTDKVVAPYGNVEDSSAEYTITKDQFVFLSPAFLFNYYECPAEDEWEPAEGQSIEDFLKDYANESIDAIETIEVFFDGIEIEEINKYRLNTELFYFQGNPDLTECYDPCITGESQPGLVDGYFLMFKKMKVGNHTIVIKGEVPSADITFEINIILNVVD